MWKDKKVAGKGRGRVRKEHIQKDAGTSEAIQSTTQSIINQSTKTEREGERESAREIDKERQR